MVLLLTTATRRFQPYHALSMLGVLLCGLQPWPVLPQLSSQTPFLPMGARSYCCCCG